MNPTNRIFLLAAFFAAFLLNYTNVQAQTAPKTSEPSFDIILQTVIASNDNGKLEMPATLSGIVKKLRTDFPFTNYRLASTIFQKVSNKGEFTSRNSLYSASASEKNIVVVTQTAIRNLESSVSETGEIIQIQRFEYNRIVPIIGFDKAITYEQIGFTTKLSLAKNTPTVVGSVTTLNPDELMFIIMTVKSAEK